MVIFFSFWQGFAISILVWAGVIKSGESYTVDNVSVAIQDFLICLEMLFASMAHLYAFSYKDYYDPTIQSARMPIKYAFKDCIGMKDVVEDTLETLRGSGFNYRTFEPAEGMSHIGVSRTSRIMAGLRYGSGGANKYWISDPNQHSLSENDNDQYSLNFPDQLDSDVESMYEHSRRLGKYGDYNFPVIDPNYIKPAPANSTAKKPRSKRKSTLSKHRRSQSHRDVPELFMVGSDDDLDVLESNNRLNGKKPRQLSDVVPPFRPGCVDLVKEVKDESGRRLRSYVETIDKISGATPPSPSSQKLPINRLDPFNFGILSLPTYNTYDNAKPSRTADQNFNGAHANGSTSYSLPNGSAGSSSRTKPMQINGSTSRLMEKRRIDESNESDGEEETDPLGVTRMQVNYLSQSVEKNAWKENLLDL